jgi:hypothetical protein
MGTLERERKFKDEANKKKRKYLGAFIVKEAKASRI